MSTYAVIDAWSPFHLYTMSETIMGTYCINFRSITPILHFLLNFFILEIVPSLSSYSKINGVVCHLIMPPNGVMGVYCFPRRQLIFSFGRHVIYHSKGLWEYIPKSILSVRLYHNLQTNSWTSFLSKSLLLYINGFISTSFTNKRKAFFKFRNSSRNFIRLPKKN